MAKSKEQQQQESSSKPVNYTLFNQKITFEFLKTHLWAAADILRGSLDPADYRQPVMTLLFLKRLNDTFEENAENLIQANKMRKKRYVKEHLVLEVRRPVTETKTKQLRKKKKRKD